MRNLKRFENYIKENLEFETKEDEINPEGLVSDNSFEEEQVPEEEEHDYIGNKLMNDLAKKLAPRMTLAERNLIVSPATGFSIFQTDNAPGFYYYNGTAWVSGTKVANNEINYNGEKINFYSETEKFHIGKRKFDTLEDVLKYLKPEVEPELEEMPMESLRYRRTMRNKRTK